MRNGWRLTCVYSDGTEYGFTVMIQPGPLMSHAEVWRAAYIIETDALTHPDRWPGFLGCGMEFRSEAE